jgi:hypothetical protein
MHGVYMSLGTVSTVTILARMMRALLLVRIDCKQRRVEISPCHVRLESRRNVIITLPP